MKPLPSNIPDYPAPGPVAEELGLTCEDCGYSLTGLLGTNKCPECGREFNPFALPHVSIPWMQRSRHGEPLAYLLTAIEVLIFPLRFARQFEGAVRMDILSARSFSRYSARLTFLLFIIPIAYWMWMNEFRSLGNHPYYVRQILFSLVASAMLTLWTVGINAIPIAINEMSPKRAACDCLQHYTSATSLLFPLALDLIFATLFLPSEIWVLFVIGILGLLTALILYVRSSITIPFDRKRLFTRILSALTFVIIVAFSGLATIVVILALDITLLAIIRF